MKNLIAALGLLMITGTSFSQTVVQTIKGQVLDKNTQSSLPGANVFIPGTDPIVGTTTDMDGYFKLNDIPVGRVDLKVSFMGYLPVDLSNLNLTGGKELILTIGLEEQVITAREVEIVAEQEKAKTNNDMATVSARTFSVEETQRFAGARNDVSRMAANFAGVSTANDAVNDIVIRGNSPQGLLWRMDEVDIPNPNHFGMQGNTGGPVSMLNNNNLTNSDFFTAAFPAQYGNALSGVFDLKLRNGNYEKHEFLGQIGFNGFELGAEGPISKKTKASYLVNYRYSALSLMSKMGIDFGTGSAIPYYQDLCFKMNVPTAKAGRFTVFGLAGKNSIAFQPSKADTTKEENSMYLSEPFDVYSSGKSGVAGITHTYLFNSTTFSRLILSGSFIGNYQTVDSINPSTRKTATVMKMDFVTPTLQSHYYISKKFNSKNLAKTGIVYKQLYYEYIDSIYNSSQKQFVKYFDEKNSTGLVQSYMEWQHKFSDDLVLNSGLFFQQMLLNNNFSVEPRVGLKWNFHPLQSLNLAYGLHSQMLPLFMYFNKTQTGPDEYVQNNKKVDFTKSHHLVLGYDYNITETFRIKAETYYQYLFDVPVQTNASTFSVINNSSMYFATPDSLANKGLGRNYGAEITVEKFLSKGFYGLVTVSLYDSRYMASDKVWRNTAFNGKYTCNVLFGKEFKLTKNPDAKKKKLISFDLKMTAAGGQRYTPVDVERSLAEGGTVYDDTQVFQKQFKDYFRSDVRCAYRVDGKRVSNEWAFDIQNVTNTKNPLYNTFNEKTGKEETVYQLGLFPMMQYRIVF